MEEKKSSGGSLIFPVILMILGGVRFAMTGNIIFLLLGFGWLALIIYQLSQEQK